MSGQLFARVAIGPDHPKWEAAVTRPSPLYQRPHDVRGPFWRDYNRIIHCRAYRRLKHKTQVFFAAQNDHLCTRIEHVNHVAAVSETIATELGLNVVLARAIAVGHDLGHAPFGHDGERVLSRLLADHGGDRFWHERNSLWFADRIETLEDPEGWARNLCLTYAVRDGMICHCGEVEPECLTPRDEVIDLYQIPEAGGTPPFTWEGCVVRLADKLAYLGRDLEDARLLGILDQEQDHQLQAILGEATGTGAPPGITNTAILHELILDLCRESRPEHGLRLSSRHQELLRRLQAFSDEHIYGHERLEYYRGYAALVLESLFDLLIRQYDGAGTAARVDRARTRFPQLMGVFAAWLVQYAGADDQEKERQRWANPPVYRLDQVGEYGRCVVHFLSGMTDAFALKTFAEVTTF